MRPEEDSPRPSPRSRSVLGAAVAPAATMHPTLGAKLAGMGEHGVVNFQSNASKGQLCWTFDVMTKGSRAPRSATAPAWSSRSSGPRYKAKSCAAVSDEGARADRGEARLLPRLGRHEGAHPGELRGTLFAGMAHMSGCRRRHGRDARRAAAAEAGRRAVFLGTVLGGVSRSTGARPAGASSRRDRAGRVAHPAPPVRAAGGSTRSPARCRASTSRPGGSTSAATSRSRRRSPTRSCGRCRRSSRSRRSTASPAGR